jgi:hypothetical protein
MQIKWNKINKFIVALLSALLLLLLWGTAVAQQNSINTDLFKFGSDVAVAESQVVKNATGTSLRGYRCLHLV